MRVLTAILAMILGGCISAMQAHAPEDLTGLTEWRLIELNGQETLLGSVIALSVDMEHMQLFGSAGCNRFMSKFSDTGERLEIGPVGLTKRFCTRPKGIMEQEGAFVRVLQSVDQMSYDGELLKASGTNGTLVFAQMWVSS